MLAFALVDAGEVLVERRSRLTRASTSSSPRCGDGARGARDRPACRRTRHGSSPRIGGTLKRPSSTAGAWPSTSSRSRLGRISSSRKHVAQRIRMRGRGHVGDIQRFDVRGVLEHRRELRREQFELFFGQLEAGELGDVHDVVAGDRGHRAVIVGGRPRPASRPFRAAIIPRPMRTRPNVDDVEPVRARFRGASSVGVVADGSSHALRGRDRLRDRGAWTERRAS